MRDDSTQVTALHELLHDCCHYTTNAYGVLQVLQAQASAVQHLSSVAQEHA